jgi:hypothetical protein
VRTCFWLRVNAPRYSGCSLGNDAAYGTDCWYTAAPISSASIAASAKASRVASSWPATIAGRLAASSRAASRSSASSEGRVAASTRVACPRSSSASASSTSPGRLTNTGPVGGVSATFAARRRMRGRSSTRVASIAHFTIGWAIGTSGS